MPVNDLWVNNTRFNRQFFGNPVDECVTDTVPRQSKYPNPPSPLPVLRKAESVQPRSDGLPFSRHPITGIVHNKGNRGGLAMRFTDSAAPT